jgi:hypothetical protein
LQVFVCFGAICQILSGPLYIVVDYPCWVFGLFRILLIPIAGLPIPIRLLSYYCQYTLAQALLRSKLGANTRDISASVDVPSSTDGETKKNISNRHAVWEVLRLLTGTTHNTLRIETATGQSVPEAAKDTESSLRLLRLLNTTPFLVLIYFIMLAPFVVAVVIDMSGTPLFYPSNHCYTCGSRNDYVIVVYTCIIIILVLCLFFAYALRNTPDPFGLIVECRWVLQ